MSLSVDIAKRLPEFDLSVSFAADNEVIGILGPSGAGKSMLLRCIAGTEHPDRGRITLGERTLFDSDQRLNIPARSRRMGMLFQSDSLFPHRTVSQNIAFGLHELTAQERNARLVQWIDRTHVRGLEHRYPRELSGGEQQRVALARALAAEPEALLLDEPLTALDMHLRAQVEAQLQETFAAFRRPTLLVTHNIEEAYRLGGKLLLLARGRIEAFGLKEEIFRRPPTQLAAQLTGCKNFSRAKLIADSEIEASDWACRLKVTPQKLPGGRAPVAVGIRAHHIEFVEAAQSVPYEENIFPCWPVRTSETPFRVTVYLRLHRAPSAGEPHHLQAEVFKEKWRTFREQPLPWHARLSPESLFLMPE